MLGPPYAMVPRVVLARLDYLQHQSPQHYCNLPMGLKVKKENVCGRKSGLASRKPRAESEEQVWNECRERALGTCSEHLSWILVFMCQEEC